MFEGMYVFYVIMGLCVGVIGVVYGIRLQMRQNWGKKLSRVTGYKVPYSEWVSVMGEPKHVGSCEGEDGERYKTATWSAPGATITVRFDKNDYAVEMVNGSVTSV